jgi:hypothetical protein
MSDTDSIVCSYKDDDKSTVKAGYLLGDWTGELTGYQQVQRVIVIRLIQVLEQCVLNRLSNANFNAKLKKKNIV